MLERKEIENYLYDCEILRAYKPDLTQEVYVPVFTEDIIDGNVKDVSSEINKCVVVNK